MEVLAAHGADIDAANDFNCTPLHEAAFWAHKPAVVTLLRRGSGPSAGSVGRGRGAGGGGRGRGGC